MSFKHFNHLNIPEHWEQYWSKYPQGYTILEALISWVSQVDEMVDNQNNLTKTVNDYRLELDDFLSQFDGNLQETITETLTAWQNSGFLDVIINTALQTQMDALQLDTETKVGTFDKRLEETDFVKDYSAYIYDKLYLKKLSSTLFEVYTENESEGTYFQFIKDARDEFFKMSTGGTYQRGMAGTIIPSTTTGTGWVTASANMYTTIKGDSFSFSTEATDIIIRHYVDSRGGSFDIFVNGKYHEKLSTRGTTMNQISETKLSFDVGLKDIDVVFNGDNERGWFTDIREVVRKGELSLLHQQSNKEVAITLDDGGGSVYWAPDHGIGVLFNNVLTFSSTKTGTLNITDLPVGKTYEMDSIAINQACNIVSPNTSGIVGTLRLLYEIKKDGTIKYTGSFKSLNDNLILVNGYPLMLPVNTAALNKLVTGYNDRHTAIQDNAENYFEHQHGKNVVYHTNISGNGSALVAGRLDMPFMTMNKEKTGQPPESERFFVWDRQDIYKTYFRTIKNMPLTNGNSILWGATILVRNYIGWSNIIA